jgi:myosin heavy subunit
MQNDQPNNPLLQPANQSNNSPLEKLERALGSLNTLITDLNKTIREIDENYYVLNFKYFPRTDGHVKNSKSILLKAVDALTSDDQSYDLDALDELIGRIEQFKSTLAMYYVQHPNFSALAPFPNGIIGVINKLKSYVRHARQQQLNIFVNQQHEMVIAKKQAEEAVALAEKAVNEQAALTRQNRELILANDNPQYINTLLEKKDHLSLQLELSQQRNLALVKDKKQLKLALSSTKSKLNGITKERDEAKQENKSLRIEKQQEKNRSVSLQRELDQSNSEKEQIRNEGEQKISEKDQEIQKRDLKIHKKEEEIQKKDQKIQEKDQEINEKDELIKQQDELINEQMKVKDENDELRKINATSQEAIEEIGKKYEEFERNYNSLIAKYQSALIQLREKEAEPSQQKIEMLEKQLNHTQQQLTDTRHQLWWANQRRHSRVESQAHSVNNNTPAPKEKSSSQRRNGFFDYSLGESGINRDMQQSIWGPPKHY